MEKLLNEIADELFIAKEPKKRTKKILGNHVLIKEYESPKKASDEIKEKFKEVFESDLKAIVQRMRLGDIIEYSFGCKEENQNEVISFDANDNLERVLSELPKLKAGEHYIFPKNTFLRVTLFRAKMYDESIIKCDYHIGNFEKR